MRVSRRFPIVPGLVLALAACAGEPSSPTAPALTEGSLLTAKGAVGQSHGLPLSDVGGGPGGGIVNVSPTAEGAGFTAQIAVNVHGLLPNETYFVQRSPDFPVPPWITNGVCERAAGMFPPMIPPTAPRWITFPVPNPGPLVTITTSPGGAGAVSFGFDLPAVNEVAFDVMFRVVDNTAAPMTELRSPCFTVTPK
jgi:hypothetical protein